MPAKWYAGAVISKVTEDWKRKYLVIDTKSTLSQFAKKPMQTKFCGGTEEFHEREDTDVLKTLHRETLEETEMHIRDGAPLTLIHGVQLPGHFKNFYDVDFKDLIGDLRTTEKEIEGDWMSAPYWVTYDEARGILFPTHLSALEKPEARFQAKRAKALA